MKITNITYKFNPPAEIELNQYNALKKYIALNPGAKLAPPSGFKDEYKLEIKILKIMGVLISISLLLLFFEDLYATKHGRGLDIPDWLNIASVIIFLPPYLALFGLFTQLPTIFSILNFLAVKRAYYKQLKNDIISSTSYDQFLIYRSKIRKY